ncbi:hypothetical protein [Micromonospora orduensis]|uniref:hypothetical protein n=1 Tax=Micromonospora orduensis TaxID=1420891 RepID=UPI00363AFC2F
MNDSAAGRGAAPVRHACSAARIAGSGSSSPRLNEDDSAECASSGSSTLITSA